MKKLFLVILLLCISSTKSFSEKPYNHLKCGANIEIFLSSDTKADVIVFGKKFEAQHRIVGIRRVIFWGEGGNYQINISPQYNAVYFDFTDVPEGQSKKPDYTLYCSPQVNTKL
jgi:hypothetical protein